MFWISKELPNNSLFLSTEPGTLETKIMFWISKELPNNFLFLSQSPEL
jgi:hypothetical protein